MMSMCGKRAESRRIYGQGHDQGKQASVCLEIGANAWEQYRKFSSSRIVDDSFGHIECLEMGIMMIARGEFLDDLGVFLDDRRNGCPREVDLFADIWRFCKGEMDVVVVATGDEGARCARRPWRYTGNDIVDDRAPILFSEQRCT